MSSVLKTETDEAAQMVIPEREGSAKNWRAMKRERQGRTKGEKKEQGEKPTAEIWLKTGCGERPHERHNRPWQSTPYAD